MEELPVLDRPLFLLDYDGTLAPIVEDPMEAYPHEDVPGILRILNKRHPVYIVTGRHLRDLAVLTPDPALSAIGLHGTQRGQIGGSIEDLVPAEAREAMAKLRRSLPRTDGLTIEEKGPAFAVHYREAADKEEARRTLKTWAEDVPEEVLDTIWGKQVVELRPAGTSKGVAVRQVADDHPACTPIYMGDDVTDEDAFAALEENSEALTVKVGQGETRARYRLPGVEAAVDYLKQYVG